MRVQLLLSICATVYLASSPAAARSGAGDLLRSLTLPVRPVASVRDAAGIARDLHRLGRRLPAAVASGRNVSKSIQIASTSKDSKEIVSFFSALLDTSRVKLSTSLDAQARDSLSRWVTRTLSPTGVILDAAAARRVLEQVRPLIKTRRIMSALDEPARQTLAAAVHAALRSAQAAARQLHSQGTRYQPARLDPRSSEAALISVGLELMELTPEPREALRLVGPLLDDRLVVLDAALARQVKDRLDRWVRNRLGELPAAFEQRVRLLRPLATGRIRRALTPAALRAVSEALKASGADDDGRASDVIVHREGQLPAVKREILGSFRGRLDASFGSRIAQAQINKTAMRLRSQYYAEHVGHPSQMDLPAVLSGGTPSWVVGEVARILRSIEAHSPPLLWRSQIASYEPKNARVRKALAEVGAAIWNKAQQTVTADMAKQHLLESFGSFVLAKMEAQLSSDVPRELSVPRLPSSTVLFVRKISRLARSHGRPASQLLYLELQAARLASGDAKEQGRGKQLRQYLEQYKAPWIDAWLNRRTRQFRDDPRLVLSDKTVYVSGGRWNESAMRHNMDERLSTAWTYIRWLVHPAILKALPKVVVRIDATRTRAEYGPNEIRLGPECSVETIMHEFGHHIEANSELGILLAANVLRLQRASGAPMAKLAKLHPGSSYRDDERTIPGAFVDDYMGKVYSDGPTEILSMGLEKLTYDSSTRKFFMDDGHYAFALLHLLQTPPPARARR
jgi:hypothetical protein